MQGLDWSIFHAINGLAGHIGIIDDVMKFCAQYLVFVLALMVATLWITPGEDYGVDVRRQRLVAYAVLSALLALAINAAITHIWFRPRPFELHPKQVTLLVPHAPDSSFPSDHAAGSFALVAAVIVSADLWARRLGVIALIFAVIICFARVFVGDHYPFDVLAGAAIGIGSAGVIYAARPVLDPILHVLLGPLHRLTYLTTERTGMQRLCIPSQQKAA